MGSGLLRCCTPSNDKTFNHGHRKRSRAIQSNINHDSFNYKLDLEELDCHISCYLPRSDAINNELHRERSVAIQCQRLMDSGGCNRLFPTYGRWTAASGFVLLALTHPPAFSSWGAWRSNILQAHEFYETLGLLVKKSY